MDHRPTVLFDEECFFCRNLAAWLSQLPNDPWQLVSWQAHAKMQELPQPTEQLQIWFGADQYLRGQDAWQYLVETDSRLQHIRWIGKKMGWEKGPAILLSQTGSFLRRICRSCPDLRSK